MLTDRLNWLIIVWISTAPRRPDEPMYQLDWVRRHHSWKRPRRLEVSFFLSCRLILFHALCHEPHVQHALQTLRGYRLPGHIIWCFSLTLKMKPWWSSVIGCSHRWWLRFATHPITSLASCKGRFRCADCSGGAVLYMPCAVLHSEYSTL